MNCGPHAADPRSRKERLFLCTDCDTVRRPPSVIDRMIDEACGVTAQDARPRDPTAEEKAMALSVAREAVWHMDAMYPGIWKTVPTTAKTSVRNTIYNSVLSGVVGLGK